MTLAILNAIQPSFPAAAGAGSAGATGDGGPNADAFGTLLSSKIAALVTAPAPAAAPDATATNAKLNALKAQISKLIDGGATQAQIVATLAAQLAASVTQKLSATAPDARASLQAVFAGALAPPGDPNATAATAADRAETLAKRMFDLERIATQLLDGTNNGQQNRISGNILDAATAKDTPAHTTATAKRRPLDTKAASGARGSDVAGIAVLTAAPAVIAAAATSDAASAASRVPSSTPADTSAAVAARTQADVESAVTARAAAAQSSPGGTAAATLAASAPAGTLTDASATAGDGRSVALGALQPIATGGDTAVGRVLARAARAADARTSSAASEPAGGSDETPVAAFVKSFAAAVAALDRPESAAHGSDTAQHNGDAPAGGAGSEPAGAASAFVPGVAPFSIERTAPAAPPAPATPAAAADQGAIVDQVLRGAFMRTSGASSEIRLSLVPEALGDVNVKLIVNAGNVTAHVIADTPEVRDAIVAAQPQLTKSLADAGLKLQTFTVDLSGNGFAGNPQGQADTPRGGGDHARRFAIVDEGDANDERLDAIPSFGPSLAGPVSDGDYNYLA